MLLIKTKISLSKIHGIGLFADQFIQKGTPLWEFTPGFDLKVDKNKLSDIPKASKKHFLKYAYLNLSTNKYVLCVDDARFWNHSEKPNCLTVDSDGEEGVDIAARDIQQGEELTINYKEFDGDFLNKNIK